jgi:uncharacterized protein with HEPN domain
LPSSRPKTRFLDIAENAEAILEYTAGMDSDSFAKDRRTRDATERCLSRISEAAVKLGAQAETMLPQHPWRQIRDLGNVIRHVYDNLDADIVWSIVVERLPALLANARQAAGRLPDDGS